MSRAYEMYVSIENVTKEIETEVIDACNDKWNFDDWAVGTPQEEEEDYNVEGWGRGDLSGGEGEEGFAIRLSQAIWEAAGRYLPVSVDATYLESLPYDSYTFDEDDYAEWKKPKVAK